MKVPQNFRVHIAGNFYENTPNLIVYASEPILRVDRDDGSGRLRVGMTIYDSSGRLAARIEGTKVVEGLSDNFRIVMTDKTYVVREAGTGRTTCEIRRSNAARKSDIDVFVMTHAPNGFFIHANPKQSNAQTKPDGKVYSGLDAALVMS